HTLALHDALPTCPDRPRRSGAVGRHRDPARSSLRRGRARSADPRRLRAVAAAAPAAGPRAARPRGRGSGRVPRARSRAYPHRRRSHDVARRRRDRDLDHRRGLAGRALAAGARGRDHLEPTPRPLRAVGLSQPGHLTRPSMAPPFNTTAGFLARFVEPLLGGGVVEVEAPLSSHDRAQMLEDAGPLLGAEILHLRTRVAQRLVAEPMLPEPNADELSLWLGLHDVLALDHPDTERVWTRESTWRKVELETRSLLAFARPVDMADALARHLAVGAF